MMLKNIQIKAEVLNKPLKKIFFGFVNTKYGEIVLGYYLQDGVTHIYVLQFTKGRTNTQVACDIQKLLPDTACIENSKEAAVIFATLGRDQKYISVVLNGTEFQTLVWKTLLQIPYGENRTYSEVAAMINSPNSTRAVASAVGRNNIAIFVPCHRVKAKHDDKLKYRWGSDVKMKLLMDENSEN